MKWTVYCHTHTESGRRYIGLTARTMGRRWSQHVTQSKSSKGGRWHFPNAIRKYGPEAFSHEELAQCRSLEDGNATEQIIIAQYDTTNPEFGFNLAKGGGHTPHPEKKNPWDRPGFGEKVAASMESWFKDPVNRALKSARSREVNSRPEVRKKLSEATTAQFSDPVTRRSMSETIKKLHQDPAMASKFMTGLETANRNRASKTHCKNGHEFTPENTRVDGNGWRCCIQCQKDRYMRSRTSNPVVSSGNHGFRAASSNCRKGSGQTEVEA